MLVARSPPRHTPARPSSDHWPLPGRRLLSARTPHLEYGLFCAVAAKHDADFVRPFPAKSFSWNLDGTGLPLDRRPSAATDPCASTQRFPPTLTLYLST